VKILTTLLQDQKMFSIIPRSGGRKSSPSPFSILLRTPADATLHT
jgi:hypothetical protein